jgi:uncharacterized protein (DUF1501 family)
MALDRRTLIARSCMTAAALAARPNWAAAGIFRDGRAARSVADSDTVLVVVDMAGGNDGLNTVVPFADPAYRAARRRIGLTGSQLLSIDAKTGLHPSLSHLHDHLDAGRLAIVQGVGYPGPDMSHFRSDDIWETAVPDPRQVEFRGWLGRALDQLYRQSADALHAVSVSGDVSALHGEYVTTPVIGDPGSYAYPGGNPDRDAALQALFKPGGLANHEYVSHIGEVSLADATAAQTAFASYTSTVTYPDSRLGASLKLTASVLVADLGPRVFCVTQDGYDTHSSQLGDHERLLLDLDQSLDAFYQDLVLHGHDQRVVVMTYSEFGRRVEDNGSGGTDHGTAAPLFVLGSRVKGGIYGAPSSLTNLDADGNLKFTTDFRQVYASVLANWIDADPVEILFGNYPTIAFL